MITAKELAFIIANHKGTTCQETFEEIEKMGFNPVEVGETYSSISDTEIEMELNKLESDGKFSSNYDRDDIWVFGETFSYCLICKCCECKWWSNYHD